MPSVRSTRKVGRPPKTLPAKSSATKSLVDYLKERARADQIYRLPCLLDNLHATQGRNDGMTKLMHQASAFTADSTYTEGVPEGDMAATVGRRRKSRVTKEREVQTYRFERDSEGRILLEIGGAYGLFGKALRDACAAQGKASYRDWMQSLALIRFAPAGQHNRRYIAVRADTTIDARDVDYVVLEDGQLVEEDTLPEAEEKKVEEKFDKDGTLIVEPGTKIPRMEPRNKARGERVMVPVFHERISHPIHVDVDLIVNSQCPRSTEEVAGLIHSMKEIAAGPAKRGRIIIEIEKVERIQ